MKERYLALFVHKEDPAAKNLVKTMFDKHDTLINKAERSSDPTEAFAYLKEAHGIILVLEHIESKIGKKLRRE